MRATTAGPLIIPASKRDDCTPDVMCPAGMRTYRQLEDSSTPPCRNTVEALANHEEDTVVVLYPWIQGQSYTLDVRCDIEIATTSYVQS